MRRVRIAGALLLVAVSSAGALADRLDKSACNLLNAELSGLVAAGTRDDMERGPLWAKTNLPQEKLQKIMHLIELEEQLEFRCGMSRSRVATTAPAKVDKVLIPEEPERKPERKSSATKSIPDEAPGAKPMADVVTTVSQEPATSPPSPRKAMIDSGQPLKTPSNGAQPAAAAKLPATRPSTPSVAAAPAAEPAKSSSRQSSATESSLAQPADDKPLKDVVKTVSREPAAASPSPRKAMIDSGQPLKTPSVEAQPAAAPAKTAAAPAASAAAAPATEPTRSSRRQSSAGYVSPTEVNPFFVTRYGDTQ